MYIPKTLKLRTINTAKGLKGKHILLRVDFNVPINSSSALDNKKDWKIKRSIPTINYLIKKGAKIILVSHLGRPKGKWQKSLSLAPVAKRVAYLLKKKVYFAQENLLKQLPSVNKHLQANEIMLLENIRFYPGEEIKNKQFLETLRSLGDIYVNDAFAVAHHPSASTLWIADYLPAYAGFTLAEEVKQLTRLKRRPKRPLCLLIGGAKIKGKLNLIKLFLPQVDYLLVGGGLANNFFKSLGFKMGRSLVDESMLTTTAQLTKNYRFSLLGQPATENILLKFNNNQLLSPSQLKQLRHRIILPIDVKIAELETQEKPITKEVEATNRNLCQRNQAVLDIGPETIKLFSQIIKLSKTILWNGPLGNIQDCRFVSGSYKLAKTIASSSALSIIGGGDLVGVIERLRLSPKINFISTGGGAMLEFLIKGTLPCLTPLLE